MAMRTYAVAEDCPLPGDALDTTIFFKQKDSLFDTFNSSAKYDCRLLKCAVSEASPHWEFLEEMYVLFGELKCVDGNGKATLLRWLDAVH
jgi:hypothetical protein